MATKTVTITAPTVHLNGSSRSTLLEGYQHAQMLVGEAERAVAETAPNARDYYVQGSDVFQRAVAEHRARLERLHAVLDELEALAIAVDDAPGRR